MADLSVAYMGLKLKNPVILSSGPLSDTVESCKAYADAGVSAITLKSIFHRGTGEIRTKRAMPRFRVMDRLHPTQRWNPKQGLENMGVFGWGESGSVWGEEKYGWFINEVKRTVGEEVKVGASIVGSPTKLASWDEYLDICKNSDADYLEIDFGYDRFFRDPEMAEKIIKKTKRAISVPLAVKFPPFVGFAPEWAKRYQDWGVDGLCIFDKGWGLDFDLDMNFPNWHQGTWNYCPCPTGTALPWVNYNIMLARKQQNVTIGITASWDVWSWEDVIKSIMSGADAAQVHTRFMVRGPKEVTTWLKRIDDWLEEKNHKTIRELQGTIIEKLIEPFSEQDAPREVCIEVGGKPSIKAVVDPEKCTGCLDLCTRCCMYFAISDVDHKAYVEEDKCGACGLCVSLCPSEAISFQPR